MGSYFGSHHASLTDSISFAQLNDQARITNRTYPFGNKVPQLTYISKQVIYELSKNLKP